jgi:hypothetical protein
MLRQNPEVSADIRYARFNSREAPSQRPFLEVVHP